MTRGQLLLYGAAVVAVVLLGARYLRAADPAPAGGGGGDGRPAAPAQTLTTPARDTRVTVHIAGAVRRPGVYRLKAGERIDDALQRAGGATARADLSAVNLAAKVEDGRQILVPERVRAGGVGAGGAAGSAGAAAGGGGAAGSAGGGGGAAAGVAGASGAAGSPPGVPLDLNTATAEQLDTLPGVGPATAAKILAYRDEHGGFGSVDELAQVPGIGDKRMAALKELVRV